MAALMSAEQQADMELRQMKDFLNTYNRLSEQCFTSCCTDFSTRTVTKTETQCVTYCVDKFLKMTQRISQRLQEYQQLQSEGGGSTLS
ncbi:mitochondrial import inner membrane translocase subunit Tim9-like [Sycon ciliatum]|uniref:mitochondrial import inner membrane translocase subunit Tim9-like n=1 Tax=Sycon ciliatum TaxID=27933 RepID=UPI0031F71ACA